MATATLLQGSSPSLQGSSPALQGSSPVLQGSSPNLQTVGVTAPNSATPPPAPKTPTIAPAPSPTYSFLDGSKYAGSGKQLNPPTVMTAKPAITDLANKQAALDQATQAQGLQTQNAANQTTTPDNQTPPPPAPAATADDLQRIINGTAGQEGSQTANSALKAVQDQADATYASFTSKIQQIMNGTFPLTPSQQAQVNATQASFNALKIQQDLVNRNFQGQVRVAAASSGLNITAPQIELGQIKSALDNGIAQISAIDSQASKAIADLQQGFMDKDYTMINNAYTAASNLFHDKSTAIQDMNTNVRNATNDALQVHQQQMNDLKMQQDEQQRQLQNQQAAVKFAVDNGINKPFYLVGNTAIDAQTGKPVDLATYQKMTGQQVGLPESKTDFSHIQHVADPQVTALMQKYPDAEISPTDSIEQAQQKLQGSAIYYKEKYIAPPAGSGGGSGGSVSTTDANGNPIDIPLNVAPYYNQSHNGVGWVDASTLQGTAAQKNKIVSDAQAAGLKVITNKNSAADLTNINDAYSKLNTIGNIMQGIDQPGWVQRALGGAGLTYFQEQAQSSPQKAAAGALSSIGLDILKAISGVQGFRGNQSAIDQVKQHLPSIYDTNDTVQTKINYINQLIADRENALTGSPKASNQDLTSQLKPGEILVKDKVSGQLGAIPSGEFDASKYEKQ